MKPLTCKILLTLALLAGLHQAAAQTPLLNESPTSGVAPLTVGFSANINNNGNPVGWNFQFGDGSGSASQSPVITHIYTNAGTYFPSVLVSPGGEVAEGQPIIVVPPPPPVQFTASPTNGSVPLAVQFNSPSVDGYTNAINSWSWNFGDGSTSTSQNPSHTYARLGNFNPSLSVIATTDGSMQCFGPSITVTSLVYTVDWFKVAGGGGTSTGDVYTITGTFGQQDAGASISGGGYMVTFGFWSLLGQGAPALIPTVPIITSQPKSLFVTNGTPAAFSVSVSGTPPLFYQWQKNGVDLSDGGNISGSTTANLVLSTTTTNDAAGYSVVIKNAYGNVVNSSVAKLTLVLPAYYITDIGSLGGIFCEAFGINNNGQVVGDSATAGQTHAFLYSGGTMTDLGTLGGDFSEALGINNNGQVVGTSFTSGNVQNSFLYSGGSMSDLDNDSNNNIAYGINDNGQIVGFCAFYSGGFFGRTFLGDFAFLDNGGNFTDLGTLAGSDSYAYGINNSGQVIGYSYTDGGNLINRAFLYNGGTMNDLGTLGGSYSKAYGINNSGQVVGDSFKAGDGAYHAFLYSGGTMNDLGILDGSSSAAYGINNSGQVVGYAYTAGNAALHAFLYSGAIMLDLNNLINTNTLGTYLYEARGINDSGQIIANGNNSHAYILTPSLPTSYLTGSFPPKFQTMTTTGGNFQFSWNTVNTFPPIGYQVQTATNLTSANWINLGGVLPGTTATLSATNTIGTDAQRFYRVLLVQ
jgi:probable HAF family extracellular repeat protein